MWPASKTPNPSATNPPTIYLQSPELMAQPLLAAAPAREGKRGARGLEARRDQVTFQTPTVRALESYRVMGLMVGWSLLALSPHVVLALASLRLLPGSSTPRLQVPCTLRQLEPVPEESTRNDKRSIIKPMAAHPQDLGGVLKLLHALLICNPTSRDLQVHVKPLASVLKRILVFKPFYTLQMMPPYQSLNQVYSTPQRSRQFPSGSQSVDFPVTIPHPHPTTRLSLRAIFVRATSLDGSMYGALVYIYCVNSFPSRIPARDIGFISHAWAEMRLPGFGWLYSILKTVPIYQRGCVPVTHMAYFQSCLKYSNPTQNITDDVGNLWNIRH
ncbi:hypothetical protein FB451DRAFT_1187900 [Mycena latifolia]|nr:hypothetical protein FB451DRAFT_1187900 [Mycena latifolia]